MVRVTTPRPVLLGLVLKLQGPRLPQLQVLGLVFLSPHKEEASVGEAGKKTRTRHVHWPRSCWSELGVLSCQNAAQLFAKRCNCNKGNERNLSQKDRGLEFLVLLCKGKVGNQMQIPRAQRRGTQL